LTWREQTRKYEQAAYFVCLAIMAASLTLSTFMMSISQFLLLFTWLFIGDSIKVKLQRFIHNKIAILLVSLYLLHLIGLAYTSDFHYAFKDLRIKLPLLVFPLILSSVKALEKRYFDLLMLVYVIAVFIGTCISFGTYLSHSYGDIREISRFISHIRFCLNIVLVIGIIAYYLFTRQTRWWEKAIQLMLICWFVFQLYIFESISGYLAFFGLMIASLLFVIFKRIQRRGWRIVCLAIVIALPLAVGFYLYRTLSPLLGRPSIDFKALDKTTAMGNDYWHDTVCFPTEDGKYIGLYFCRPEMRDAWNQRSQLDYDGLTQNGENLEATLARYLTSKDLRKDASGVTSLTDEDIRNVENGVANYNNFAHPGIKARISETLFEYNQYRLHNNPNGGSLSQRIEYTRASLYLIKKHPLFGVGTGDIPTAFQQAYDELDSPLEQQYRHRAHNQYLAIAVTFGLVGLLWFLLTLLVPYCSSKRHRNYLYTVFLVIMLISMLAEDTLETQAGVSLFAFFNSLLIFAL
jgi:hypothetical protein